jgi:hypothetical protein
MNNLFLIGFIQNFLNQSKTVGFQTFQKAEFTTHFTISKSH